LNVAHLQSLFWDGRAASLEEQARAPFVNAVEHGLSDHQKLLEILRSDQHYSAEFSRLWPAAGATMNAVAAALAAYERTLVSARSRFDRYYYGKERDAMSEAALRGMELFRGRANCVSCHTLGKELSLFTDQSFHMAARGVPAKASADLPTLAQRVVAARSAGDNPDLDELIATDANIAALGRFLVTLDPSDIGKFKTPSLRNVAETAPYMHDGGVATLEEAVELELYSRGAVTYPIILTRSEKADLIEFLKSLSDDPVPISQ
jgi:cytochrome c peroxidase